MTNRNDLYTRAQAAITEIESAILELLTANPSGLTNSEIGRRLGIYFGHDGHEGHISRSILAVMQTKGIVRQQSKRGPWEII